LAQIITGYGFRRFGVAIINADLSKITSAKDRKQWHINSYSYTGFCAAVEMRQWSLSWSGPFPELVYEDGDTGRGELKNLLRKAGYPEPIFRPKKDRLHKRTGILQRATVPLQAADLYAYDIFSRARDIAQGKPVSRNFAAGINQTIERLEGISGVVTPAHIQFMSEGMEQLDSVIMQPSVKIDIQTFRG
jgi:hypothetical protein